MADSTVNGAVSIAVDVEMKEEGSHEAPMNSLVQADELQPLTAQIPQAQAQAQIQQPEQPSITEPIAIATPPATSGANARPGSMPPQPSARPEKPVAHGGPTRQYLNANITPHLLEGMKYLAVYEPDKPLQWLSDFLRDRSKEVEG